MGRVTKRESAKRDLIAQWVWYAEQANFEIADRFLLAVESTATALARQPESGTRFLNTRPDLQDIRRFPVSDGFERFLLFYLPIEDGIELVRVVEGTRELQSLFSEGKSG